MAPYLSKMQKIGVALSALVATSDDKCRKKRKMWAKNLFQKRKTFTHANLLKELDSNDFRNFLRMDEECFINLLDLVKPFIQRRNTVFRESVSAEERLIVTLRYLATGRSYEDMKFSAAISPQLLSAIIPETCAASNATRNRSTISEGLATTREVRRQRYTCLLYTSRCV